MHRSIKEHLEDYLRGDGERDLPPDFHSHLSSCRECRDEILKMKSQARMLRLLRPSEETEPAPGFYARVMNKVEAQRTASIWDAFLEPVFARSIVVVCMIMLVLLTSYMVTTEPQGLPTASSPEYIIAVEPSPHEVVGDNPELDRQAVLLTLATYGD